MSPLQPRGVRNNNPGNIKFNPANKWQGRATWAERTPEQRLERTFEVFKSPEWGVRAMARLLINYYDHHGCDTILKIIARWAPSSENDTAAYALGVARTMSTDPSAHLDLHDYDVLRLLVLAIIRHENGLQPYSDAVIDKGLVLAGVAKPLKPLTKSKTIAGGTLAATSTAASTALEVAESIDSARLALAPAAETLDWIRYLLVGLTLLGVGLVIYARVQDNVRRVA